jgi:NADH dehydrogenase (ubiquinone) Fe-S protein 2
MATALLRRQLRLAHPQRCFSIFHPTRQATEHSRNPAAASSVPGGSAFDRPHTVEDLHGMSAVDILAETGTSKDTAMRHFTGGYHTINVANLLTGV